MTRAIAITKSVQPLSAKRLIILVAEDKLKADLPLTTREIDLFTKA